MSVKTCFKAATSLFVYYHEQCDVCSPLTWEKLLCFPENDEIFLNNMLVKGCKHLKCGNLYNNNASVLEQHENL